MEPSTPVELNFELKNILFDYPHQSATGDNQLGSFNDSGFDRSGYIGSCSFFSNLINFKDNSARYVYCSIEPMRQRMTVAGDQQGTYLLWNLSFGHEHHSDPASDTVMAHFTEGLENLKKDKTVNLTKLNRQPLDTVKPWLKEISEVPVLDETSDIFDLYTTDAFAQPKSDNLSWLSNVTLVAREKHFNEKKISSYLLTLNKMAPSEHNDFVNRLAKHLIEAVRDEFIRASGKTAYGQAKTRSLWMIHVTAKLASELYAISTAVKLYKEQAQPSQGVLNTH